MKIKNLFKENGILSGKRVLAAVVTGTVLIGTTLGVSASGHEWGSKGDVVHQNNTTGARTTIFDKSDLEYLDERIDTIEGEVVEGKETIANKLNTKGTNNGTLSGNSTFSELANGVVNSQKIPGEGEPFLLDGQQVYKLPSGEITTDGTKENAEPINIVAANENNLSAGTAAWVDGSLIIGTGVDNNSYYKLGWIDGQKDVCDNLDVKYTYHSHRGTEESGGECYEPLYKKHSHSGSCYQSVSGTCQCGAYAGKWYNDTDFRCEVCGHRGHGPGGICGTRITTNEIICGKTEGQRYEDEGIESYVLSCGKTEETIESATIFF